MFLTSDDYTLAIKDDVLDIVTDSDTGTVNSAELTAQAEIESYLNQRFDVAAIFEASGEDRNALLVTYMVDVALYHLHTRINPRNIPEIRMIRYSNVIDWLKMVASGKISPNLPRLQDGEGNVKTDFRFGSNTKFGGEY
jgi:phage gp36-like protein